MKQVVFTCAILLCHAWRSHAALPNANTDWLKEAHYGVFMHFLPGNERQFGQVADFDVDLLAEQLDEAGARYFVFTLGQNKGYFNSPNATYNRYSSYKAGEKCATRDLPLDLYRALAPKGIRLMLYLPCQVPNENEQAQRAFGLSVGKADQPLTLEFGHKWAEVIREWSDRYGDKVAGWWFDGGYEHIQFHERIAQIYAAAAKHGNPKAIVTFNPGVKLIRYTRAEDYTAGELNEPFSVIPTSRWVEGSQWHALTYLGSNWGRRDTRYPARQWAEWVNTVAARGGAVTLDMGPNWDPDRGAIGSLAPEQLAQLRVVRDHLRRGLPGNSPDRSGN